MARGRGDGGADGGERGEREVTAIPAIPTAEPTTPTGWDPGAGRSPYAARPQPMPGAPMPASVPFALPQLHQAPLDGVSVAAVVTGVLATGPVALVLGVIGLRRTTRSYRRSPRIATTGIVLGAVGTVGWSIVGVLAGLGAFGGAGGTAVPGDVAEPATVHSSLVAAGNCVELLPPQQEVGEVRLVPCGTPHAAQVISTWEIDVEKYPGPEGALTLAEQECGPVLEALGADETLLPWWFVPTPAAWDEGERTGACLLRAAGEPLTSDLVS